MSGFGSLSNVQVAVSLEKKTKSKPNQSLNDLAHFKKQKCYAYRLQI